MFCRKFVAATAVGGIKMTQDWFEEADAGMVVCDEKGIILSMNERAAKIFRQNGGRNLVGKSMMGCHPADAQKKIAELLESKKPHAYTVEVQGVKWLLYQSPWFEKRRFRGYIEFILPLPAQMAQLPEIRWVE
jgi:transcriptional regulator with PAS, ATPase and Fis domain